MEETFTFDATFREVETTPNGVRASVRVIKPGVTKNKTYYSKS